jgi:hypothetical protein
MSLAANMLDMDRNNVSNVVIVESDTTWLSGSASRRSSDPSAWNAFQRAASLHQQGRAFAPPPHIIDCKPRSHHKRVLAASHMMGLVHLRVPQLQVLNTVLRREISTRFWNAAATASMFQSLEPSRENGIGVLIVSQAQTMNGCQNRHMDPVTNGNGAET